MVIEAFHCHKMVFESIPLPQDGVQILVIVWLVNKNIPLSQGWRSKSIFDH
jgi:hypothetical protein